MDNASTASRQDAADHRVKRLLQLYMAQGQTHQAMREATDFHALCVEICRIVVEVGGLSCALVRLHDPVSDLLLPVTFHGPATGLLGRRELPAAGGSGVSAVAFSTGRPVVVNDATNHPITTHIGAAAREYGIASAAAFPLITEGRVIGTLAVFGPGTGFFDDEIAILLRDTACALAYAHASIKVQQALSASERDLQLAQQAGRIGSVVIDLRRGQWMLSRVGYEVLGVADLGWRALSEFTALLAPHSRDQAAARMRENIASGQRTEAEYEIVRPADGRAAWIKVVTESEFGDDGTALRRIGTVQDIGTEKAASLALATSEERFKLAIGASQVGLWDWDLRSGIAYLSDEYLRMFGYAPGEVTGDLGFLALLVHPEDRNRTLRSLFGQWTSGESVGDLEQRFVCKDGSTKWVRVMAQIVEHAADGSALRMVGTASDLTARKAYEERILHLSRLYAALSKTNEAVVRSGDFATLCAGVCRIAVEDGGMIASTIRVHDPAADTLVRVALHGPVEGSLGRPVIAISDPVGMASSTFRTGQRVIVEKLEDHPLTRPTSADARTQHIGAAACFPLIAQDVVFGTFTVFAADNHALDGQVADLLSEIADAVAFARAKLAAEARNSRLSMLYDALSRTNEAILREGDFAQLCTTVCRIAVEVGGMVSAALRLHDPAGGALVQVAEHGPRAGGIGRKIVAVDDSTGVAAAAFRTARRVIVHDIAGDSATCADADSARAQGIRAAAAFPLIANQRAIGTFTVFASDAAALDGQIADLLQEIADALAFARAKHQSEAAQRESEARIAAVVGSVMDAIISCDDTQSIVVFNEAAARMFGCPAGAALGTSIERFLPERLRGEHGQWMRAFANGAASARAEGRPGDISGLRADGTEFPAEASISQTEVAGRRIYTVVMRDVTARVAADRRIQRLSNLYAVLIRTNEAIVREADWHTLCETVCRIIVEHKHVEAAVIRMPDTDRRHLLPFARYGRDTGPLGGIPVALDDASGYRAAIAFRECRSIVVDDLLDDTARPASHADAVQQGIRSMIVVPVMWQDRPIATLSVFAAESGHFDDELTRLYAELAGDLAYAHAKLASERAMRESETRYRTLVDASPDAVRVVCDDRIVMVNPACLRLFGVRRPAELLGRPALDFILPEHHERARERARMVLEEGAIAAPIESSYLRPDGSSVDVEVVTLPFNYDGKPAALSIIRDLTERKSGQRALAEAELRYRSLVEASQNGVLLLAGDLIAYANPGTSAMLGFARPEDVLGTSVYSLVLPEFHAAMRPQIQRLSAHANQLMPRQHLRMRRGDASIIDVTVTAASIDLDGHTMIQVELRDVTRERLAHAQIRAMNETLEARIAERTLELTTSNRELEAANRDLESFSYSVAHDLRAPLRSMAGFANLLEMDISSGALDDVPAHAARIAQNAVRMNALIDGLLAVSRVTHGALNDDRVDFAQLVIETVREVNAAGRADIRIDPLPVVKGDTSALRQVWANLLSNAIKYSARRDRPEIRIAGELRETEYVFHVRDNGAGFDPAYAGRLFGVFQRLHSAHEFEGTGVGLAIVRRIVERHGGHVWAEGRPNQGATFYFTLPTARIVAPAGD